MERTKAGVPTPSGLHRRTGLRLLGTALVVSLTVLTAGWLWLGVYHDREHGDAYLFVKHRPSLQLTFNSPLGTADQSPWPGHEGYLDATAKEQEAVYVEFVESGGGTLRAMLVPFPR